MSIYFFVDLLPMSEAERFNGFFFFKVRISGTGSGCSMVVNQKNESGAPKDTKSEREGMKLKKVQSLKDP